MKSLRMILIVIGVGLVVAAYWALAAGALSSNDQRSTVSGLAGGARSSPSTRAAGPLGASISGRGGAGVGGAAVATTAAPQHQLPPLLLLSPASIVPENVVGATEQGFEPGEQIDLTVVPESGVGRDQLKPTARASADKDGKFYGLPITVTVQVPMGDYTVSARGKKSGLHAQAGLHVEGAGPYANPSTYSGKGGSAVSFDGGGFRPQEIVSLYFDSLAVDPLEQVMASVSGAAIIATTVPMAEPGDHAFVLVGKESGSPLRIPFSVVGFGPWFAPDNYSPTPEQRIGFAGHDFAPNEDVRIYFGKIGAEPIATVRADQQGGFDVKNAYEIPDRALGSNLFLAEGIYSRVAVSMTVDVQPFAPVLELTVYAGPPGTSVAFKGSGYARGETLTAYLGDKDSGREVAKFTSGGDGSFAGDGSFSMPSNVKAGSLSITVVGERSRVPRSIKFEVLPLTAWAGLSRFAGPPGTTFSFEGHGFQNGERVSVHLGERQSPALSTVKADDNGGFMGGGSYTVPDEAADQTKLNFVMVGESSGAEATATFQVTIGAAEPEATPTSSASPSG